LPNTSDCRDDPNKKHPLVPARHTFTAHLSRSVLISAAGSFAEKMARDASQVTHGDIETLRAAGFSDRAILDAAHVTGFFSYMNRVVQALGADGSSRSV